ncbi:uncharacterized protein LOC135949263 [Calliphora vicina]|uniref:uncharacterized protein LOC135949263 n=1 Tax=Calliphora vicina TaxID=7373 RepID=UPI00325BBB7A
MFPSSQMDQNKFCCDRSTCPKRQQRKEESSIQSSSLEGINKKANKETQMSASITSTSSERNGEPAKTCEKSSEAYFDRNNQNISCCHNKFCPSNSSQTSQTESHMCSVMLKCPAPTPTQLNRPLCCVKCMRPPQSIYNTLTTSSLPGTSRQKCSCKQLDITSSSSSSITSEHFPVKLTLKSNSMENQMPLPKMRQLTQQVKPIFVTSTAPRPERLPSPNSTNDMSSNCEQFYSCSSEDSESENTSKVGSLNKLPAKVQRSRKRCKTNKNCVILELLHEVVHLINKDSVKTPSSLDDKNSKMTIQESEIKIEGKPKDLKPPTTTQFAPLTWPPPCLCCAYGIALGQGQPFNMPTIQPYNLMSPAATASQIPQPFVYEETDCSFKDCSSGNKSLIADKIPDNLCCICSNITDICPKHGPVIKMLKKEDFPSSCKAICSSPIVEQQCPIVKPEIKDKLDSSDEDIGEDPPQDSTLNVKREFVDDDEESRWEGKPDIVLTPKELEEDVDEELHPRYVDKMCIDSPDNNEPNPDCLLIYDDEEPQQAEDIIDVDEEIQPIFVEQNPFENYEPSPDCLMEYDDEDPSWTDITNTVLENSEVNDLQTIADHVSNTEIMVADEPVKLENATLDNNPSGELDKSSHHTIDDANETLQVTETERSPYIVETSPTTGRNVYNFLPEIDKAVVGVNKQIIRYNESEEEFDSYYREEESELLSEEEYELAKEKRAESRKKKKLEDDDVTSTALATIKQLEGEGSPEEMKFFIDSLIMDFEAMEYARRKSQFEKNICKSKSGLCARNSFPVTITDVTDLGANSLYVKWSIHDCCGIGGYEIYTDGYLTNRYYNSRHEAAVITQVDVTLPHKVALVAQPTADDESLELMCNLTTAKNKPKCLPWKTDVEKEQKSYAALWTPSIFLYNPNTCRATVEPPIMRDNF